MKLHINKESPLVLNGKEVDFIIYMDDNREVVEKENATMASITFKDGEHVTVFIEEEKITSITNHNKFSYV